THPEEGGIFRRKSRTMRRSGLPLEHPFIFYPRRLWEVVSTSVKWGLLMWKFHRIKEKVKGDPLKREYRDLALTPVLEEDGTDLSELPVSPGPHSLLHIEKYKTASTTLAP
ncbi:MAG: radical SAM protein, partial [Nitrospirota bacterium]|nr:radical SAM protein [Nitrospirota bacterium]